MSDQPSWIDTLSPEALTQCGEIAEFVISERRESLAALEKFRSEAHDSGLSAIEDFLFQTLQSDQRVLDNAVRLFSAFIENGDSAKPRRDHLVDEDISESFPASDPPTYARIT